METSIWYILGKIKSSVNAGGIWKPITGCRYTDWESESFHQSYSFIISGIFIIRIFIFTKRGKSTFYNKFRLSLIELPNFLKWPTYLKWFFKTLLHFHYIQRANLCKTHFVYSVSIKLNPFSGIIQPPANHQSPTEFAACPAGQVIKNVKNVIMNIKRASKIRIHSLWCV